MIFEKSIEKILPIPPILQQLTFQHEEVLHAMQKHEYQLSQFSQNITDNLFNSNVNNTNNKSRQRSKSVSNEDAHSSMPQMFTGASFHSSSKRASSTVGHTSGHGTSQTDTNIQSLYNSLAQSSQPLKGALRADVMFQITIFQKLSETETKYQIINNVDVKGWMKSWSNLNQKTSPHKIQEELEQLVSLHLGSHIKQH